jgi:hypothetical protein
VIYFSLTGGDPEGLSPLLVVTVNENGLDWIANNVDSIYSIIDIIQGQIYYTKVVC